MGPDIAGTAIVILHALLGAKKHQHLIGIDEVRIRKSVLVIYVYNIVCM